jgi:hypothetical protein
MASSQHERVIEPSSNGNPLYHHLLLPAQPYDYHTHALITDADFVGTQIDHMDGLGPHGP